MQSERELLDPDSPIAGSRGTQSRSINHKIVRNEGLTDTGFDLVDLSNNSCSHLTLAVRAANVSACACMCLRVCLRVYVCVSAYTFLRVRFYVYIYVFASTRMCLHLCVRRPRVCACVWVYVYLYMRVSLGVHVCTGAAWTLAFRQLLILRDEKPLISVTRPCIKEEDHGTGVTSPCLLLIRC